MVKLLSFEHYDALLLIYLFLPENKMLHARSDFERQQVHSWHPIFFRRGTEVSTAQLQSTNIAWTTRKACQVSFAAQNRPIVLNIIVAIVIFAYVGAPGQSVVNVDTQAAVGRFNYLPTKGSAPKMWRKNSTEEEW